MTTNKPEVVAWYFPSSITTLPVVSLNAGNGNGQSNYMPKAPHNKPGSTGGLNGIARH